MPTKSLNTPVDLSTVTLPEESPAPNLTLADRTRLHREGRFVPMLDAVMQLAKPTYYLNEQDEIEHGYVLTVTYKTLGEEMNMSIHSGVSKQLRALKRYGYIQEVPRQKIVQPLVDGYHVKVVSYVLRLPTAS